MKAESETDQKMIQWIIFPANTSALFAGVRQNVAHEVDPAALPGR